MSRRIGEDFLKLNEFLGGYTLYTYNSCQEEIEECKTMHKKLYGLMVFIAEYCHQNSSTSFVSEYLDEMASDLLLSLFNWVQGMYKPAKLELRCGIENFLKSILSIDTPTAIKEKSVYEIFDLAKADKHFDGKFGQTRINQIRNIYVILCRTVHSSPSEIHSTSALNLLPKYEKSLSQEVVKLFIDILENCLGILYFNYPIIVDSMHPENKKDFFDCLSKTTKSKIYEILYTDAM